MKRPPGIKTWKADHPGRPRILLGAMVLTMVALVILGLLFPTPAHIILLLVFAFAVFGITLALGRMVSLASGVEQRSAHRNPNRSRRYVGTTSAEGF